MNINNNYGVIGHIYLACGFVSELISIKLFLFITAIIWFILSLYESKE